MAPHLSVGLTIPLLPCAAFGRFKFLIPICSCLMSRSRSFQLWLPPMPVATAIRAAGPGEFMTRGTVTEGGAARRNGFRGSVCADLQPSRHWRRLRRTSRTGSTNETFMAPFSSAEKIGQTSTVNEGCVPTWFTIRGRALPCFRSRRMTQTQDQLCIKRGQVNAFRKHPLSATRFLH